jgi:hypothetical protein
MLFVGGGVTSVEGLADLWLARPVAKLKVI